jgi:CO/xanthine dehydrogenase Mo-binding subunit
MVRIQESDTAQAPYAGLSAGSKTTYTVGLAVRQAVADAREQLLKIAAEVMEAHADDLLVAGGWVTVRGVPDRRMFVGEIARLTMQYNGRYAPVFGRGIAAPSRRAAAAAAHLAEVRVDGDTGVVTVERYVAVHDVGRAINPPAVRGQIQGGVAQGIGWALLEQMVYDEQGTLVTVGFADYALPSFRTVPPIDVRLLETPLDFAPFGARIVGEPPVVPVAAAIANAVCDAAGARVSALPITPEDVLAAGRRPAGTTAPPP